MTDYAEYINAINQINMDMATARWIRGRIVYEFLNSGEEGLTAGDIAAQTGVASARLSEDKCNYEYYGNLRTSETVSGLAYDMFTRARQKYPRDVELAMEALEFAKEQAFTVAAFRQHLDDIYFEKPMRRNRLPINLQGLVPPDVDMVWIVCSKPKEED
jgi:hypothetical protein